MITNVKKMVLDAEKHGYAVPAFNVHNLENMRACVEAAVELRSPLILACTPSTFAFSGLENIIAIAEALARNNDIPLALHMDHHHDFETIKKGIDLGIKSVMIDASKLSYEENIKLTKKVVDYARKRDVTVEAELGAIPGVEDALSVKKENTSYTDPASVRNFIEKTGVDTMAIAIGTAHGIYKTAPVLNTQRLLEVREAINVPLVLHGGSGLSEQQIKACIKNGVRKVNIGTELKAPFVNAIKEFWKVKPEENDPRFYLTPAVKSVKELAKEKIKICMADGRY